MTLAAGQVLQSRYRIVSLLGQGGMGAVYRAWDTRLDVYVALKEMVPQPGLDRQRLDQLRHQFQSEAKVLARLEHPNLVDVSDFFSEGDRAYLVMKFIAGESLAEHIRRHGALSEGLVLTWADQLLDALAYCHNQGIIHRDVKPQNVIIRPDGQAVLVDFGLVKLWDPADPRTRTAIRAMGTPQYAPPEQYDAHLGHTDARSDVYSLGATLYHTLTGRAPPTATQRVVDPAVLAPLRTLNPEVSRGLEAAVMRALALQPAGRYRSAADMARALRKEGATAAPGEAPERQVARPSPERQAQRKTRAPLPVWVWAMGGLLGLALLALVAGLVIALGGRAGQKSSPQIARNPTASPTPPPTFTPESEAQMGASPTRPPPTATSTVSATLAPPSESSPETIATESPPTATPALTSTPLPTATAMPSPTQTPVPSPSPTQPPPPSPTPTQPPTPTWTPTATPTTPTAAGLRITGLVLWGSDPVAGAGIELKEQGNYYDRPILAQTTTGSDGRFTLDNPPAGDYQIYAVAPSEEYWRWTGRPIQIPVGAAVDAGTFYLKKKLQLLEPADGTTVGTTTPTLRWSGFPSAVRYHVDLFVDATGDAVLRKDTTDTSLVVSPALSPGVRYQWSVDAHNADGVTIAYYSAWRFTVP
jgi:serine/threonine-protein kinase